MAKELTFANGSDGVRLWLNYHGYAKHLLAGDDGNPWASAGAFLAFFSQAQGLLRPSVAILDVRDMYLTWLKTDTAARTELSGKRRPMAAMKYVFEAEKPRALLREIISAVAFQLKDSTPLVLSVPSPRHWFWLAASQSSGADIDVSSDDAENAAVYLADFVRAFSDLPISGILLEERAEVTITEQDAFTCYKPVFNVSKHYRWPVCVRLPKQGGPYQFDATDIAMVIGAEPSNPTGIVWAVDVSDAAWSASSLPALSSEQILFIDIPTNEVPEKVLDTLNKVRASL
jgi:hypothetical protein